MGLSRITHREQSASRPEREVLKWYSKVLAIIIFPFAQEDSRSLPASTIRHAARKNAEREMNVQREEFQRFGIMADWNRESTYRTLGNPFLDHHVVYH